MNRFAPPTHAHSIDATLASIGGAIHLRSLFAVLMLLVSSATMGHLWAENAPPVISDGTPAFFWTPRDSARNWTSIASSSDGTKLAAVVYNGQIYTSTDSGVTWMARDSNRWWSSIASSSDGTKLAAVVPFGQIYTSTDSGVTWMARDSNRWWSSIASSSDGTKLAAGVRYGQIYTSTDSGVTWTARHTDRSWASVASSSDGTKLAAGVLGGQIYTSTDSGVTWTARASARDWKSIASSSDGTKLAAVVGYGQIYTSTDSGVTWTARDSTRDWSSITSSSDGTKLAAVAQSEWYGDGRIYTSGDGGVTWTAQEGARDWTSIASSNDGTKLAAVVGNGQIYTSVSQRSIAVTMSQDSIPTAFALTLNATDADADILTWSISGTASQGTATASGTGLSKTIGYTPNPAYHGADSFVVQVSDGNGGTDTIVVQVTMTPFFVVTYHANAADGGTVPVDAGRYATGATVTVLSNSASLVRTGFVFLGWNTSADGAGFSYPATGAATLVMYSSAVQLHALWGPVHAVSYHANAGDGGMVPVDAGRYAPDTTVTVLANSGSLVRTGFTFLGWNTRPDGAEITYPSTGTATFTMDGAPVDLYARWLSIGFVPGFYQHALLRTADAGELARWTDEIAIGRISGAAIAKGFFESQEFLNRSTSDQQYVEALYGALCGRTPDADGLAGWLSVLAGGMLRADVLDGFLRSAEFAARCQQNGVASSLPADVREMQVRALVRRFYRNLLGREPEASGIDGWTLGLLNGNLTGFDLANGFVTSHEFRNRNLSAAAFVSALYRACFNRSADAGQGGWISGLQGGYTRTQVVNGFVRSQEFINQCIVCAIVPFASPG